MKAWNAVRSGRMTARNRNGLGQIIQESREEQGISQTRLAEQLHVGKSMVCNWESGVSRPDVEMMPSLCAALNIPICRLYGIPSDKGEMQKSELLFLKDYMELEPEDRRLVRSVMKKMLNLELAELKEEAGDRFVRVLQIDSEDFFKPGHGGHFRWIRKTPETEKADFLVTVSGRSLEPFYSDDDDLVGALSSEVREGFHSVVLLDDEPVILRRERGMMTGMGGRIRLSYEDRSRITVIGEITGKIGPEDLPDDQERMVLDSIPSSGLSA